MINRDRPGLSDREKVALARLETAETITGMEKGQLKAFVFFGDEKEAARAGAVIAKHQPKDDS